jgi:16S rRNA (uracil1498-N3)-methyltransferase
MRHVPHVLVPSPWHGHLLNLDEQSAHHLRKVLRLRDGAAISYTDGQGRSGEGVLEDDSVARGQETCQAPSLARLTVAVAPPRSTERTRFLVEKLGELGVDHLVWLRTERTVGRPPRIDKATAWAREALEQSGGVWMMQIDDTVTPIADLEGTVLVADPEGAAAAPIRMDTTLIVGPEGGLTSTERAGTLVCLGDRILRVETAAIVGATLLKRNTTERGDKRQFTR